MCHVNNSEAVFPIGKNNVTDPQGLFNPAPATTSACTACHSDTSGAGARRSQTDPKFGESCDCLPRSRRGLRRAEGTRRQISSRSRYEPLVRRRHSQIPAPRRPLTGRLAVLVGRGRTVPRIRGAPRRNRALPQPPPQLQPHPDNKAGGIRRLRHLPGRATKTSSTPSRRIRTRWWKPIRSAASIPKPANPATARAASTRNRCPPRISAIPPN